MSNLSVTIGLKGLERLMHYSVEREGHVTTLVAAVAKTYFDKFVAVDGYYVDDAIGFRFRGVGIDVYDTVEEAEKDFTYRMYAEREGIACLIPRYIGLIVNDEKVNF